MPLQPGPPAGVPRPRTGASNRCDPALGGVPLRRPLPLNPPPAPQDSVEVTALDDADVPGVTLYISDFKRSLADKLAKDFFTGGRRLWLGRGSLCRPATPAAA
jgi:hypothetical protein